MSIKYEKTTDPNVFDLVHTHENAISKTKLIADIENLEDNVSSHTKTKPDQETLDFWNSYYADMDSQTMEALASKQALLSELEKLEITIGT